MDGECWLEVEPDLARDIRETVHEGGSQLQVAAGKVIADTVFEVVTVESTARYNSHLPLPSAGWALIRGCTGEMAKICFSSNNHETYHQSYRDCRADHLSSRYRNFFDWNVLVFRKTCFL